MLSKNKIKLITSLSKKKGRETHGLFLAEGSRLVNELLASPLPCHGLFALESWAKNTNGLRAELTVCEERELKQISQLNTPQQVLGLFKIPEVKFCMEDVKGKLSLFLDQVQDPGNLGTIIRLADWFGIEYVFCAVGTVDAYSPKVVQATMGAIASVHLVYVKPENFFAAIKQQGLCTYGTFMAGENMYKTQLDAQGIIVLGNEGNGISDLVSGFVDKRISIPKLNASACSESLNVAMAASIVCSEFVRRQ